jgi:hypothetical protein
MYRLFILVVLFAVPALLISTGSAIAQPDIVVAPEILEFGAVLVDQIGEQTISISNEGNADLRIDDIIVEGAFFGVDFNDEILIQPGSEHELVVTFAPEERGVFEGEVTIVSNDPDEAEVSVSLHGVGSEILLLGQCETPGDAHHMDISGNFAYVVDGHSGLLIIDISNPERPNVDVIYDTPGYANGVTVSGDHVYVGDHSNGLLIIDISDPQNPDGVGRYDTPGHAYDVTISGDFAYQADNRGGLHIIDVSDPQNPDRIGGYNTPENAQCVAVSGDYAYVADQGGGLQIIDISNPENPNRVGRFDTPGRHALGVTISGDYAYVADGPGGLLIIDITNLQNPDMVGQYDTPGVAHRVTISGDYAYVADGPGGLQIIDISNPERPEEVAFYPAEGQAGFYDVFVSGEIVYVTDYDIGFFTFDVSDFVNEGETPDIAVAPEALDFGAVLVDQIGEQTITISNEGDADLRIDDIVVEGAYFGVEFNEEIVIQPDGEHELVVTFAPEEGGEFEGEMTIISDDPDEAEIIIALNGVGLEIRLLGHYDTPGIAQGVKVSGEYAYIADGEDGGLHIIDISDPENPNGVGQCDTPGRAQGLTVSDIYAYIADFMGGGLQIIDISDPENPNRVGQCDTPGFAHGVDVSGDYAYVADHSSGLQIIDISDPENPNRVGQYNTPGHALDVTVSGDYAYVTDNLGGLLVLDISDPGSPNRVGHCDTPGNARGIDVSGDFAYVADQGSGLQIIDISDPGSPNRVAQYNTGDTRGVEVSGDYAYVVGHDGRGLQIIDISDPESLIRVGLYVTDGNANRIFLRGEVAYVADGENGLLTFDVSDYINEGETPDIAIAPEVLDFGGVLVDQIGEQAITISNHGDADLRIDDMIVDGAYFSVDFENEIVIQPDGEHELVVTFTPEEGGEFEGEVTIISDDPDEAEVGVSLNGFGIGEQKITAEDAAAGDYFCYSVSINGDYAIVGAPYDDDNGEMAGSAYIFIRDGEGWIQQAKLTAEDADAGDTFGLSVSMSGDYAIVGSFQDDDNGERSGSAYIFVRDGNNWSQQAKLTADDGAANDGFGQEVSISGDYVVVGAVGNDDQGEFSGSAYIFARDGENWSQQVKLTADDGAADDHFGFRVSISGDYALIGAYGDNDNGGNSGSAYVFIREGENWSQQAKLTADDGEAGDELGGYGVCINGNTALLGAYGDDNRTGSAYIFVREGENWSQQAKLMANDRSARDRFGMSSSISGGVAVVGSYLDDDDGENSGSVYTFHLEGENWIQASKITASDAEAGDHFGWSVSISGASVIIGAYDNDDDGEKSGSAYIYQLFEEEPTPNIAFDPGALNFGGVFMGGNRDQILTISNNGDADLIVSDITTDIPFSVAFDGEFMLAPDANQEIAITFSPEDAGDFEGELTITSNDPDANRVVLAMIGSCGEPDIAIAPETLDFGAVLVDQIGEQTITITNEGNADLRIDDIVVEGAYFSVDFNDEIVIQPDGEHEVVVTFTPEERGEFEGEMTIISDDPDEAEINIRLNGVAVQLLLEEQKITADDGADGDHFGMTVSTSGDYALVGSPNDNDRGESTGSAYIFVKDGDEWIQQAKLTADDAAAGDYFGNSLFIRGDYAIIGAFGDANEGAWTGSAYVFVRNGEHWSQQAKLTADDASAGDGFSQEAVSIDGNYAIVGACTENNIAGSAYIFVRDGENWTQQTKLTADNPIAGDYFGYKVSINGDYAVVSVTQDGDGRSHRGFANVYIRDGVNWTHQATLAADDGANGDIFGRSVSLDRDYVVVGAPLDQDGGNESGSAYIFMREGENWSQQAKLTADDADAGDRFGFGVSISGQYVVIGSYLDDDNGNNSGSAYLFGRDGEDWTQIEKLTPGDAAEGDIFGHRVSINGNNLITGSCNDDDNGENSGSAYIYQLFEEEPEPDIAIAPEALDFGAVLVDQIGEQAITISNHGDADLRIDDIIVEGAYFSVDFENEIVVEPDAEVELVVTFAPEERGVCEGILRILSNDPNQEETLVALSGSGDGLTITLHESWNLISINISPPEEFYEENDNRGPDVILMMEQLRIDEDNHHVLLMKDEDGRFYFPAFGFNNIPYWDLTEGYQVKVDQDVEAVWIGEPIPADSDIWLDEGWNIIPYFPTYNLDAGSPDYYVLSPIIEVVEMAKNNIGRFMTPEFNFSNMPPWRETQGYQVKVTEDVRLNYPEMQDELASVSEGSINRPLRGDWTVTPTGHNMSVLINSISGKSLNSGSQVGVLSSEGMVVGSGFVDEEGRCGLVVWGDDPATPEIDGLEANEAFTLRVWDAEREFETVPEIERYLSGKTLQYQLNGLAVIDLDTRSQIPTEYFLASAYPNPFNSATKISYGLPEDATVSVRIFDITGRLVTLLLNDNQSPGTYSMVWNASELSSGVYILRLEAGNRKFIQKVVLMR